jgi:hypothetical protein
MKGNSLIEFHSSNRSYIFLSIQPVTCIGLSPSYDVIKAHVAEIKVESPADETAIIGVETAFVFTIPTSS